MSLSFETIQCQYLYDPLDRWAGSMGVSQSSLQRFYQKNRLATQIQGAEYTSLFQHDDQLLAQRDSLHTSLLTTDLQRSILSALNADQPVLQRYSPYGHCSAFGGTASLLGFNGERPDPVTGHYLLGNGSRAYNPILMRFNSPDNLSPFGKGGLNSYAYCSGDPVNWQDPSGNFRLLPKVVAAPPVPVAAEVKKPEAPSVFTKAKQVFTLASQALVPSKSTPDFTSVGRQIIRSASSDVPMNQAFPRLLREVNDNLNSHGVPLDKAAGEHYGGLLQAVERGNISSTTGHLKAANYWMTKTFGPERVVGVSFNAGGALLASAHDSNARKTGAAIRWS